MINYEGKMIEGLPAMPVEILGMNSSALPELILQLQKMKKKLKNL